MNLALFDLDDTLIPLDSDYEWGQFLVRIGAVDGDDFSRRNASFFAQYQAGTLDPVAYLEFALGTLARFPRGQLNLWHSQFMAEVITPEIRPAARALLQGHRDAGDLVAIITATNRFVTAPIARALDVGHLMAALPEETEGGEMTGKLLGVPSSGAGKVRHLQDWLGALGKTLGDFKQSHFYSDSHNDLPLMSMVTHPVATNPNARLEAHAKVHGWQILKLFDD